MRRTTVPAVACGILILSGCTPTVPEPSPTAAAECGPDDARVRWGQLAPAEPVPIGYRLLTVEDGVTETGEVTQFDYSSTVDSDPERFEGSEWVDFLIEDLNRSGQSITPLGDSRPNLEASRAEPQGDGDFIIEFRLEQVSASFSIECGPITEAEGRVTTTPGNAGVTLSGCGAGSTSEFQQYCAD